MKLRREESPKEEGWKFAPSYNEALYQMYSSEDRVLQKYREQQRRYKRIQAGMRERSARKVK